MQVPAQAAQTASYGLLQIKFEVPEGLTAGLGCAITWSGHYWCPSGAGGARAFNWCSVPHALQCQERKLAHQKNGPIQEKGAKATGLRFVNWAHHDQREKARAAPPPEAAAAAYRQIEQWLPVEDEERDNILVLTT